MVATTQSPKPIRLCILQAGEQNPAMPTPVAGYAELFKDMFAPFPWVELDFIQVRHGIFPQNLDDYDAFLVTGSAAGVYDDFDWIPPLRDLIRTIAEGEKPLVGICFGHQIIADTLGGKAVKSEKGWGVGIDEVALTNPPESLKHFGASLKMIIVHQDQVITPPDGAEVFASTDFCPIAAYRVGDRILSFQGHPEFTPEVLEALMEFREESMGGDKVAKARETLNESHDSAAVASAIVDFITPQNKAA